MSQCVDATEKSKRKKIMLAAQRLCVQDGFCKISIDDIAHEAGVSKPTVYAYFSSKHTLFKDIMEAHAEAILQAMPRLFSLDDDPRVFLQHYGEAFLRVMDAPETIGVYRYVAAELQTFPEMGEHYYVCVIKQSYVYLAQCLSAMDKAGKLQVEHPELSADMFLSTLKGRIYLERFLALSEVRTAEQIRKRVEVVVDLFLLAHQKIGK